MILSEDENKSSHQIKSYEPGLITVNDAHYKSSLIISPEKLILNWRPSHLSDLQDSDIQIIIDLKPHLVLLGTGDQFQIPEQKQLRLFYESHIGIEFMDNAAACRTYIALSAEARNVVVALLI